MAFAHFLGVLLLITPIDYTRRASLYSAGLSLQPALLLIVTNFAESFGVMPAFASYG